MKIDFFLNGKEISLDTEPDRRLLDILREDLNLTGTKEGCSEGECGSCTVIMDGETIHACLTIALQLDGRHITTIEGLAQNGKLHLLQQAFEEELAVQCGFCTPGMIMSAYNLLTKNPDPEEWEVRKALEGNICRCSGYEQIVKAVLKAAAKWRAL